MSSDREEQRGDRTDHQEETRGNPQQTHTCTVIHLCSVVQEMKKPGIRQPFESLALAQGRLRPLAIPDRVLQL
jgi:hypothetical protein